MTHSADEYRGYRIPKGSIVLANAWWARVLVHEILWTELWGPWFKGNVTRWIGLSWPFHFQTREVPNGRWSQFEYNRKRSRTRHMGFREKVGLHIALFFLIYDESKSFFFYHLIRICPGRFMAASTIWITVASLITAFDIKKSNESGGLDHGYGPGILRYSHISKILVF